MASRGSASACDAIGAPKTRIGFPRRWALERHGLQAAYAPLVSEAGPAE